MELEKLQMIIAEVLSLQAEEIRPELSFIDDLGADSLEVFQIIMGIEEEFDIVLEDEAIKKIDTVEDVLKIISNS